MYRIPFYLTEPVGNNAFSYDARTDAKIRIASILDGSPDVVEMGDEVVFEDFDEKWRLQSAMGLKNFIRMDWQGIPLVLVDNHNHVLYFWYEARKNGIIGNKNTLVHIDEHSDLRANENNIPNGWENLEEVFHFVNHQCNVGNYLEPAMIEGIVNNFLRIEDTVGMGKYHSYKKKLWESMILNLDLDFFSPELDYIDFEDKKHFIRYFASQSDLITVATSPFFIDQERAIEMFRKVFD